MAEELGEGAEQQYEFAEEPKKNAVQNLEGSKHALLADVLAVAWPVMLSYVAVGIPCGILATKAGLAPWMTFVFGFTYFSGGGQFMVSNLWLAGTPIASILTSVAAISTRFALYSASLAPYLQKFGKRESFTIAWNFSEESFGISLSKLANDKDWTARHAWWLSFVLEWTWALACLVGAFIGGALEISTSIAAFAMTSLFIYLLYVQEHTSGYPAAIAGAVFGVVLCKWTGLANMAVPVGAIAGVLAGLAVAALRRGERA